MKQKQISGVLILALSLIACESKDSGSCSKKIDCPGFSDTQMLQWFPYTNNQQLVFQSNLNEQQVYSLKNTFTTDPYQQGSGYRTPACSTEKTFQSLQTDSSNRSLFSISFETSTSTGNVLSRWVYLRLKNNQINFQNLTNTGFGQVTINSRVSDLQHFSTLTIGNKTYSDVISARIDTSSHPPGIYQVYFSINKGLLGYADYTSARVWVKQ
jgi:hypothetical protein